MLLRDFPGFGPALIVPTLFLATKFLLQKLLDFLKLTGYSYEWPVKHSYIFAYPLWDEGCKNVFCNLTYAFIFTLDELELSLLAPVVSARGGQAVDILPL